MSTIKFEFDKAGFPMVWVDAIETYVHWLPVTKIQFETFIADQPSPQFDERWYLDILELNPRISPKSVRPNNYWQLFITGINPVEAQAYAEWCGEAYKLPTLAEWNQIYQSLNALPTVEAPFIDLEIKDITRTVLEKLEEVGKMLYRERESERTQSIQMLMRWGVVEWVQTELRDREWGGMGQSNSGLHSIMRPPEQGQPELPRNPQSDRLDYYGFRLLRR